nr:MAG TPA: hypothetical protein [Caudoviricetes sp.]
MDMDIFLSMGYGFMLRFGIGSPFYDLLLCIYYEFQSLFAILFIIFPDEKFSFKALFP